MKTDTYYIIGALWLISSLHLTGFPAVMCVLLGTGWSLIGFLKERNE